VIHAWKLLQCPRGTCDGSEFAAGNMEQMNPSETRAVILIDNAYQEMEVWYPYFRLQEWGASVRFAGAVAGHAYESKLGYPAKADLSYDQLVVSDFDAVVVPGGIAPDRIRRYAKANCFVKEMNESGKLVAAICHGPSVLCSAHGLLKGRRVTSFSSIKDDVINAGALWEDAEVVVDRNLITSRNPEDLPAFCRELIKRLEQS
jgi:protease I